MSVDMFEWRFRQELKKLPKFIPATTPDKRVLQQNFRAWHSIFTGLSLIAFGEGYRLPTYEEYFKATRKALCDMGKERDKRMYQKFFEGELLPEMERQINAWYECGMAELYLYVCLVNAIEDQTGEGIVLYDPRVDWKLKTDALVLINDTFIRVDSIWGDVKKRPAIEAKRDAKERRVKGNNCKSSHWNNMELKQLKRLYISRSRENCQIVNGFRLFSINSINCLLKEIFRVAGSTHYCYYSKGFKLFVEPLIHNN